jgi:GNAT superfamily N-acetyltransferase
MTDIQLSDARIEDAAAIDAFHGFGDPDLFVHEYWTYRADRSVLAIGRDGSRIVASEGLIPYELSVRGVPTLTGRSERTLVDPGYRGRSVWKDLMAYCVERGRAKGMAFVWGSTGARKAFEKAGFTFHSGHRLHMYAATSWRGVAAFLADMGSRGAFHPARLRERLAGRQKHLIEEYAILAAAAPSALLRAVTALPRAQQRQPCEITTEPRSYADLDDLYQRMGVRDGIYLRQDAAFLNWVLVRGNVPCTRLYAYREGRLAGYVYVTTHDRWIATIIDFAFEDAGVQAALFDRMRADAALGRFAFFRISLNVTHAVQKRYLRPLAAQGFVPLYRGGSQVVMPLLSDDARLMGDMTQWYLTDLWFTLYRSRRW